MVGSPAEEKKWKREYFKWGLKWKRRGQSVLTGNDIGHEGCRMINEAMKSNSTLTVLLMSCDEKGGKKNYYEMKASTYLLFFVLRTANVIDDDGCGMIGEVLKCNSSLTLLNLGGLENNIFNI